MDCKEKLALYKKDSLKVFEDGDYKHKGLVLKKDYILPMDELNKNIMIDKNSYKFATKSLIILSKNFNGLPIKIRLHRYWYHLNSSQILTLNYFYGFLNNIEKLNQLLKFFEICETAIDATLEYRINEKSEIDVAIKLENGKFVYIEIKYSEHYFGTATYKNTDYASRKENHYSLVNISLKNFKKHYQFVRNIVLGVEGNYSVFLVPKFNKSIINNYYRSIDTVSNADKFNTRLKYWEDLLSIIKNDQVNEKYFLDVTKC